MAAPPTRPHRAALAEARIETRPIICGNIARQPAMQHYPHRCHGELRHADEVMARGFAFGLHQAMDAAACDYVAGTIAHFVNREAAAA